MGERFTAQVVRKVSNDVFYVERIDGNDSLRGRLYGLRQDRVVDSEALTPVPVRVGDRVKVHLKVGSDDAIERAFLLQAQPATAATS